MTFEESNPHMRTVGQKRYELTNHLGNVLAVVSDKKIAVNGTGGTAGTVNYYEPDVISYSDYYPFHMQMPGRNGGGDYRYTGANGQETQPEITGNNSHSTAEYWMYDNRLGRRWNIDPVNKEWESLYATNANNPIVYSDEKGDDGEISIKGNTITISARIRVCGPAANNKRASYIQSSLMDHWNRKGLGWSYTNPMDGKTYNVQFNIEVKTDWTKFSKVMPETNRKNNKVSNEIYLVKEKEHFLLADGNRSFVRGSRTGVWSTYNMKEEDDEYYFTGGPQVHEFGHILGLGDGYNEEGTWDYIRDGVIKKEFHDNKGDIMVDSRTGEVNQRTINRLLDQYRGSMYVSQILKIKMTRRLKTNSDRSDNNSSKKKSKKRDRVKVKF